MPTLPLPPSCKQQQGGNAAMPTLPLTPCFPKQGGNAAIPTWQLPPCFQEQGGSAEIPTWPYHPARKSKVVMQPFPPGNYHFALESMVRRGGKTSTEIGPGITPGVIPRVSPNSSLPLSPRCPQDEFQKTNLSRHPQSKDQMLQGAGPVCSHSHPAITT